LKKPAHKKDSSALVPLAQSLPALAPVTLSEEQIETLKAGFKTRMADGKASSTLMGQRTLAVLNTANMTVPILLGAVPGIGFALGGLGLTLCVLTGSSAQNGKYRKFNEAQAGMREEIRSALQEAQIEAYQSQKRQLAEAAEQHLLTGRFLSETDASWLGALNCDDIADASDELAITVCQVRQLLAYARSEDTEEARVKPFTFASLQLNPAMAPNRAYLRERLEKADQFIAEDDYPVFPEPEFAPAAEIKAGKLQLVKEFFLPFSDSRLRRAYKDAQLPAIPEVTLQSVAPAADFAEALKSYEDKNGPLDLPAVRGWNGGRRRMLPGPKGF
jgi:hypothetical protein